jgi:hypothetical protein
MKEYMSQKGTKPLSSVAGWYIPHRQEYVSCMPHTATQTIVDRRRVYRVMADQRSRTERKAYKKAVSTLYHVGENYPASLRTNADEYNNWC